MGDMKEKKLLKTFHCSVNKSAVLEMKIRVYWSESNSLIYLYVVL